MVTIMIQSRNEYFNKISKLRAKLWVMRGRRYLNGGAPEKALACCKRSLSIYTDLGRAYDLLFEMNMPGDDYLAVLSRIHDYLMPESYVEIGVAAGRSLSLVKPETRAVGIDPNPRIDSSVKTHAKIFKSTSDDFFQSHNLLDELDASRLALAFIDGLHYFEQALKDFINVERYTDDKTVVLIHDCLPITQHSAARERCTSCWCGDVWKIIPCLMKYRPDLTIHVIPAHPSGIGIVTGLNPGSTLLAEKFNRILAEYQGYDLGYECLDTGIHPSKKRIPCLIPNDWQHIRQTLPLP